LIGRLGDLERDNDALRAELDRLKRRLADLEPKLAHIGDLEAQLK